MPEPWFQVGRREQPHPLQGSGRCQGEGAGGAFCQDPRMGAAGGNEVHSQFR